MAEDCGWDPLCYAGDAIGGLADGAIGELSQGVLDAVAKAMTSLGTMWVHLGTPNITGEGFSAEGALNPSETVSFIQGSLGWYAAAFAILGTMMGGGKMAWERRAEPGRDVLRSLLTMVVVSGAGLTFIWHAMTASDEFSSWIIDGSLTGTDFAQNVRAMIGLTTLFAPGFNAILAIILGLGMILMSIVQIMLMVARTGMLVVLAGVLPFIASFTSTEMGRETFKKSCCWTVALIFYKPAAAIIYATAFRLTGQDAFGDDGTGLFSVIVGLMLMLMALLALPALMKFVTPVVSAVGGGGGGVGGALASAIPMGAMAVGRRRGGGNAGGGGSGPSPGNGPTGAQTTPSSGTGGGNAGGSSNGGGSSGGSPGAGSSSPGGGTAPAPGGTAPAPGGTAPAPGGNAPPAGATTHGTGGMAAAAGGPVGAGVAAGATVVQQGSNAVKSGADNASENSSNGDGPSGSK